MAWPAAQRANHPDQLSPIRRRPTRRAESSRCEVPAGLGRPVDSDRSFWKARVGVPADGPRQNRAEDSCCQYVIASGEAVIAGDVTRNPLTAGNPSIESMGVVLVSEQARGGCCELNPDSHGVWPLAFGDTVHGTASHSS